MMLAACVPHRMSFYNPGDLQMDTATHDENVKKLAKLIKGINIAMMTTATDDGSLRSRPMATQKEDFNGQLWFFTDAESGKVFEIEHDRHVNLSYADPSSSRYVSISGRASLVRDKAKVKELWSPAMKAWFPNGVDDPKIALLRIDVEQAEYWDTPGGTVVHAIGFVKATLTGERYQPGDHAKVQLA
jgi:general stress protein 26